MIKYLAAGMLLIAMTEVASTQTPTISQLLEQGFEVVGTQIFPPKIEIFLKKGPVLVLCEAVGSPARTQHCSRIE